MEARWDLNTEKSIGGIWGGGGGLVVQGDGRRGLGRVLRRINKYQTWGLLGGKQVEQSRDNKQ